MISVIIPTLNEQVALPATLASLSGQPGLGEIIVADGNSDDRTLEIVRSQQSRIPCLRSVTAPRGRGSQMNAGARCATHEWLLFLHADTVLPAQSLAAISQAGQDPGVQAGCFTHAFSGDDWRLRLISWLHNWRFTRTGVVYGDQALFIRSTLFYELGGFPEQSLEDVLLSELILERTRPVQLEEVVVTDSRKFLQIGIWRALAYVLSIQLRAKKRKPVGCERFFLDYR